MGLSGFGDDDTLDEGIKEVKVGPKKNVSSSGWAVNSKTRREEPSLGGPSGKISLEYGIWSRPRKTDIKASATYRPMAICKACSAAASHAPTIAPLMLIPTAGQRATTVLRRALLLPRCFFSLHSSYRFQHTQPSQRKPSLRENIYTFPNLLT